MFEKLKDRLHTVALIREAINSYPDGICFAALGGRPILANKKINDVCYMMTGHTVTNADRMWEELGDHRIQDTLSGLNADASNDPNEGAEQILCRLQNEQVWQFQRRQLILDSGPVMQYEAADVSELYRYQMQLQEKNEQLSGMLERQKVLLQNIVENNLKKEVLHTKMRIHSDFGRLLVMTENRLSNREESADDTDIFEAWDHVISDMENASERKEPAAASPRTELIKMAEMIGCKVEFTGEQPKERRALLLLYAAIREALTNAVRHAGADRLIVEIRHDKGCYRVSISSNGRNNITSIQEGGGLSDLRRRLEQEGAALFIETDGGVVMHITIPEGEIG